MATDGPVVLLELAHQLHEDWPRVARALRNLADAWQSERAQAAADRAALAQARALLTELYDDSPCRFDHHGHCQEHNSMTDVCIMRRIAAALSGGAR